MNPATETVTGVSRIPHGVKFKTSPMRGTIAIERPNDSATRSIPLIPDRSDVELPTVSCDESSSTAAVVPGCGDGAMLS